MSLSDKDYQKKLDFQMADETVAAVKVSNANRQLEQKAYIDLHTGLPNKSKCEELLRL